LAPQYTADLAPRAPLDQADSLDRRTQNGDLCTQQMNVIARVESWPKGLTMALSGGLIVVTGVLDFATGYEMNMSAFYLVPIFLLAWIGGTWGGISGALAAAAARTLVDLLGGRTWSSVLYPVWNTAMRLILFSVVALLIATIRAFVDNQRALARIDHLTGAANKRSFEERLEAEMERSRRYQRPFTLAYLDIDNFKSVNDTFGHAVGDRLLQTMATVMGTHVRTSDTVARLGGDEFGLLLPEADEEAARSAITKIQSQFASEMEAHEWPVTISVGSLTCYADGQDVDQLIMKADRLMYAAKLRGKNNAEFAGPQPPRPASR
jgi:diguanylate cyclase (GGDEF)-like protein